MATTQAPVLPGDWVPSIQANCFRTDDLWRWDWGVPLDRRLALGGPTQTTECFPKDWDSTVTYKGSQCPPRYTEACRASTDASAITCCPTVFGFSCAPSTEISMKAHGSLFPCISPNTSNNSVLVTLTLMTAEDPTSTRVQTETTIVGNHLYALALIFETPTPTTDLSSSTSIPSSTGVSSTNMPSANQQATTTDPVRLPTNTSGSSNSSVSAGASAGIGIGAGVGVLVLALLAWLIYRRRNKVRTSHKETSSPTQEIQSTSTGYYQHGNSSRAVSKSPLHEAPSSPARSHFAELEGR